MKRKWNPPFYEVTDGSGPSNDPVFEVTVTLCCGIKGVGRGRQKKAAKHEAAKKALEQLQEKALPDGRNTPVENDKGPINPHADVSSNNNPVGQLQELCLAKHFPSPVYTLIGDEGEPHEKLFTFKCTVSERSATGTARKKQFAKHLAAQNMLKDLNENLKQFLDEIPNDPAVSHMYSSKAKEVTENERRQDKEVVERYKQIKDAKSDMPAAPLISPGTKFTDYHLAYAKQLEGLPEILDKPKIRSESDPVLKVRMVAEELHLKVSVIEDRGKDGRAIVFMQVDTHPATVQAGHNESSTSALKEAASNVLEFLSLMAK